MPVVVALLVASTVVALLVASAVVALLVATTVATTTRPGPGGARRCATCAECQPA